MGLIYNGSLFKHYSFADSKAAVYCVRPKLYKDLGIDTQYKIGFTGGRTSA